MRLALPKLYGQGGPRVVHLVLVPAVAMGLTIVVSRLLDRVVAASAGASGFEIYHVARTVAIAGIMSSVIAFLAVRYRSSYEAQLRSRNDALEVTRDFLARIIEGSAEAIVTRDVAGLVTSWNRAAEAIYGWSASEMLGQPIDRLIPKDPQERAAFEQVEAALSRGQTLRGVVSTRVRKDGKPIAVEITMSPMYDRSGQPAGSTGIVRDITSLKEMEALLVERERLAAIGEVAAIVAHEVRNPLAGIRGGCEILLEGYPPADTRAEIGREVIHQVDRLNRTVHELLLYARPKAIDPVPTEIHGLLDRLLAVLREDPVHGSVTVRREYGPEAPVARVDGRQIEQVFLNLLLNACQAMGQQGEIVVSTLVNVETVEVAVRDRGPGIPPETMEQIFKPFFTTRAQGTGLGLAICRKIVEAHGGRIEVASPEGGGARFVVILPRAM